MDIFALLSTGLAVGQYTPEDCVNVASWLAKGGVTPYVITTSGARLPLHRVTRGSVTVKLTSGKLVRVALADVEDYT